MESPAFDKESAKKCTAPGNSAADPTTFITNARHFWGLIVMFVEHIISKVAADETLQIKLNPSSSYRNKLSTNVQEKMSTIGLASFGYQLK